EDETHSTYGQWLGWFMAAIYISGRFPQIWLNIKRGSVEYSCEDYRIGKYQS
ncbi:unnamed protein product, partial [Sphenostylis stenocarpa]